MSARIWSRRYTGLDVPRVAVAGSPMDAVRNPFVPGAGSNPPELAGRETILQDAQTAIQRALIGKSSR